MTKIFGDPSSFVDDATAGFTDLYAQYVQPVPHGVVRSTATPEGKVAVVVGGGSGHYPAFAGYVGPGLADGAVCGNVFASPSTRWVYDVAKAANRGGGVVLGFGNYAGDILNFGLAAERLRAEGIPAELIVVTDDVASEGQGANGQRRGIAGDVVAFKIAGAAAEAGYDFDGVVRAANRANDLTRSMGIAFAGCTLPGETEPLFTVTKGHMGVGLGIHGEPGISEEPIGTPEEIAELLVQRVLDGKPEDAPDSGRITVLVNGLGSTKYEELFLLYGPIAKRLRAAGYEIVAPQVGELVTSLDMAGASLTVTWLDEELETLWTAPAQCPAMSVGPVIETTPAPRYEVPEDEVADYSGTPEAAAAAGQRVAALVETVRDALKDAEAELGRIDAIAGDGDHGIGMVNGSVAAAEAARRVGVGRVVDLSGEPESWWGAVTAAVEASGPPWTHLWPGDFMENSLLWAPQVRERGTVREPWPDAASAPVALDDVAEVAAAALLGEGHEGRALSLTGPQVLTRRDLAAALGRVLGRDVPFVRVDRDEAVAVLAAAMGEDAAWYVDTVLAGFAEGGAEVTPTVAEVTGRPATTFEEWARRNADVFQR